jgi:hypothetical protein
MSLFHFYLVLMGSQKGANRYYYRHTGESRYPVNSILKTFLDPGFHRGDDQS